VDYFAHRSASLGDVVFETVRQGQRVTFDPTRGDKGPRAQNVRLG
jgi:cold shock CspA family protein